MEPKQGRDIWAALQAGEQDALMQLYNQYYVGLINYGVQFSKDRGFVTDCITETFIHLWDKRSSLPSVQYPRSYVFTMFKHIILQHFRSEKSREEREGRYQENIGQLEASPEENLTKQQHFKLQSGLLQKTISKLSARQQELLKLRFYDDLSYDELSEKCHITKRTAYNIIQDALKTIRQDLRSQKDFPLEDLLSLLAIIFTPLFLNR
ncbi:RNA polymerase sigma factor [Parapedobacter tibetensis]|uniref:RNA polymerase sigma factor n=1 Tax=Parapedobacter tibetensis TaxID=2972951 RepID=UPI00214D59B6|nr:sigma-70 family RNA polymerase sigma factor [Parapedobacter tibetensis]